MQNLIETTLHLQPSGDQLIGGLAHAQLTSGHGSCSNNGNRRIVMLVVMVIMVIIVRIMRSLKLWVWGAG